MERYAERNSRNLRRPAAIAGLIAAFSVSAFAGVMPVGQPEYDFLYQRILNRQAFSLDKLDYQVGPYRFEMFADSLDPFGRWLGSTPNQLQAFGFVAEDYRAVKESRSAGYESLRGGFTGEPFKNVSIYADFILDEELAQDSTYSGKVWRGLAGDVDQAFVTYTGDRFAGIAGRFAGFWGPQRSLIFSREQKLDGIGYSVRWGRLGISYRLGALDGLNPDEHDVDQYRPRWVAAHRFDVHLSDAWRVGFFETVVFGGPGRQLDLFYLNPLIFMHGAQLNENLNDNTMVGIDFDFQSGRMLLYGQFLIDDLQVDNQSQSDQEPDQIGLIGGGYFPNLIDKTDLKLEYERVNNWTFNQIRDWNRYLNDGRPIGSTLGNDYDRAVLELIHWWRPQLNTTLHLGYTRRGEGRIEAEYSRPWLDVEGDYSEPFPTGTVEKTATMSLRLSGYLTPFAFVDLQAGVDRVRNLNHIDGDDRSLPFVRLYFSAFLLSALNLD
jgi:hypothetical protein